MSEVKILSRFKTAVKAIKALEEYDRYEAAFIFGSVAEGTSNDNSDFDVRVIIDRHNPCENVNHPHIGGVKLDISFTGFAKFKAQTERDLQHGDRGTVLLKSIILFDKTGRVTSLKNELKNTKPKRSTEKDYQWTQFMLYHANNKVEQYIQSDPDSALYSMHANIGDVLRHHYKLQGRWWVSSKKVLEDLETWDKPLAAHVRQFVSSSEIKKKFLLWSQIIDHVAAIMGGRQPIEENLCDCADCRQDLKRLLDG